MSKVTISVLLLLLTVAGSTVGARQSQHDDSFNAFWTKFKTAVISRNKRTVAALSEFPLGIGETLPPVENAVALNRRFNDVFNNETNAAQCFKTKKPSPDTEVADRYTVVCPNKDDNFVVYEFDYTQQGWKFIHRQFPTKCRCR